MPTTKIGNHFVTTRDRIFRLDLMNEIAFMKTLGYHPHVLNLIGCVSSQYNPLLIVEYCANGDLLRLLRTHREDLIPAVSEIECGTLSWKNKS